MSSSTSVDAAEDSMLRDFRSATGMWWVFLVTGVIWLIVSMVVLRFNTTSITTVGIILGVVLLMAAFSEFLIFGLQRSGWRWVNLLLGAFLFAGAFYCFISPQDAFWDLASVLGLLLVLVGTFQIIGSVLDRADNEIWWLGLIVGILELFLGFWASQQFFPARAALILIWVGFFALFRGISEIVLAFRIHSAGKDLDAAIG